MAFALAEKVDRPDEILHASSIAACHLGLHYLQKYAFRRHSYTKGEEYCVENGLDL